ncbi:MAG: helicase-exonuclease AddAB subunit AddA [Ruminococcus sp.]|nr:helicase-exonuclease AddAB subunit AddA [Ruminococcus sp.]
MRQWTDHQLDAITARGGSVIVSAAAGSGKTSVLTERVVRMITEDGVDADRILVVTYTKAAAAEVRGRIRAALGELVRESPDNPAFLRQMALLNKAHISTVDSFFSSLVKEFFYVLNIDRNFRIAETGELNLLKADALNLTLDELYAEGDPKFLSLVDFFSSARDDRALCENILRIYEYTRTLSFPDRWMEEKLREYDDFTAVGDSVFAKIIFDYTAEAVAYVTGLINAGLDKISYDEKLSKKLTPVFEELETLIQRVSVSLSEKDWNGLHETLSAFAPTTFPRLKNTPEKTAAKADRDACLDVVKQLQELYRQDDLSCLYDIEIIKDNTAQLFKAVRLFSEIFSALKETRSLADFSDLSHWAIRLVFDEKTGERSDIAKEISSRFDEILIDEFQDANDIQYAIFKAISKDENNLFVVGDVKQSIYTFRQARPELFLERKNDATLYNREHPVFPAKIILEKNFRSAEDILSASNFFFSKLMSRSVGDIDYNEEEMLYPGPNPPQSDSPCVELNVLNYISMEEPNAVEAEADFIAKRILELTHPQNGEKAYQYADIAVLMRKEKGITPVYSEVLKRYGIPTDSAKTGKFLESMEIILILNILRVISNPALDIELLSVLMCPVFGFDEDDMARIRLGSKGTSLYAAVIKDSENGNLKSAHFLSELSYYRDLSLSVPLSQLICVIYDRSFVSAILSVVSESPMASENLRVFLDHARSFEQNTGRGLSSFITYIDRLIEEGTDLKGAVASEDPTRNAVTLMSVHSSKGLEFPVCFLSNTADAFISDAGEDVLLHPDYGIAMKRRDTALNVTYNTLPRKALALELKRAEKSEELRILYVGMTRAKEKLIMTCSYQHPNNYPAKIAAMLSSYDSISPFVVRSANKSSDWILMCAMLHRDGKALREIAGAWCSPDLCADFPMKVNLINSPLYEAYEEEHSEDVPAAAPRVDERIIEAIRRHSAFSYPYEELLSLPVKVAASELSHKLSDKAFDRILSTPAFMQEQKLTAADRGTALHAFMQYTDFEKAREDIAAEINRLTEEGYLTEVQAQSIDIEKASAFIRSPLVDRCIASDKVYKEYRFSVELPAFYVKPSLSEQFKNEKIILQGAVDLSFVENGKLIIVDYKTDRVKIASQLVDIYSSQLLLYKRALEECLGMEVSQCLIYSVHLSQEILLSDATI